MLRASALSLSVLTFSLLTATVAPATPTFAQAAAQQSTTDWKQGAWGHLSPTIGTYDYDLVLKDPAVDAKLTEMLGEKEKAHLLANLEVRNSIGFDRDCLVLSGNADKDGGFEQAYLNVCLYAGTINVAMLSDSKVTIYSATDTYAYLPPSLRQWVYGNDADIMGKQPPYVVLKPSAQ